jgi:hypothetical protein
MLACGLLAACGDDPLRDVPTLSEVETADAAGEAEALPDAAEMSADGGFLDSVGSTPVVAAAPPRRGFLGFFWGKADAAKGVGPVGGTPDAAEVPEQTAEPNPAELVAAARARAPEPEPAGGGFLGGLFGGGGTGAGAGGPAPGAPDYAEVGPGVTLPFGQLARLCGTPDRALGQMVARYPERGRGYKLYDSNPGSNGQHNWFVTGFDDGCARQFSAALALFGSPEDYEVIRYGPAGATMPVSTTDGAYETLKSKVCGVRKGQACGSRIGRMAADTVFVSIYPNFGDNQQWKNLLLHDGTVLAADLKQN